MLRHVVERVVPMMVAGSAIVCLTSTAAPGDREGEGDGRASHLVTGYTAAEAERLAGRGVRINCVDVTAGGPAPGPDAVAWTVVFLASLRASSVTGAVLPAGHRFTFGVETSQVDTGPL